MAESVIAGTSARTLRSLRSRWGEAILFVGLLLVGLTMVYPLGYMVVTSLRSTSATVPEGRGFSIDAWRELVHHTALARELGNSAIITCSAIAIIVALSSAAGFAFAKVRFRGQSFMFYAIIACMMVPVQSFIVPLYVNFAHLHLIDHLIGPIVIYAAVGIPFGTFLMTSFFRGLPTDIVEAALCDGLGHMGAFRRVALPLAKPAIASVAVLQFILIWNDLLVGLLFLQTPDNRTITVGLAVLASGRMAGLPLLMAGSLLSAIPALAVYALLQRYLISGLTAGVNR